MINNINIKKTDHANVQTALLGGKIAVQNYEEWEKLKQQLKLYVVKSCVSGQGALLTPGGNLSFGGTHLRILNQVWSRAAL